jgi:hypothetical protein
VQITQPLPPVGQIGPDDHGAVTNYLAALVQESVQDRADWANIADDSLNLYTYGTLKWPTPDIVLNDIQNAIIAATDIQTREAPRATLEPVETGDQGPVVPTGPPQLDPTTLQAVQPSLEINDRVVAEVLQSVFDRFWARASIDQWVRDNLLRTNTEGWAFTLFEWDDAEQKVLLQDLSIRQVYCDRTKQRIQDFAYAGVDLVIDVDDAKKRYPQLVEKIEEAAQPGNPIRPVNSEDLGNENEEAPFNRRVVTMRVFWLRNQPCAMSAEQAIAAGHVVPREVPVDVNATEGFAANPDEMRDVAGGADESDPNAMVAAGVEGMVGEAGLPSGTEPGDVAQGSDQAGEAEGAPEEETQVEEQGDAEQTGATAAGEAASGEAAQPSAAGGESAEAVGDGAFPARPVLPATRVGLFLPGSDAEVDPTHPAWPTRLCIRQIIEILNYVVEDIECPHWDIPLLHNVCIPVPAKPYGIGEPFRLQKLQIAMSRIVDSMVQHVEYNKYPLVSMPESVYEAVKAKYGTARIKPGETLPIPDDLWLAYSGNVDKATASQPLSPASVELQDLLGRKMTEQSGHTEALRGISSGAQESGKKVDLLQQAASTMIGFKAKRTQDVIERLTRLMLYCLVNHAPIETITRIVSKYPPEVMPLIMERAQSLEWDVDVKVEAAMGQAVAAKKQEAIQLFQLGLISKQTCQERLGVDVQQEQDRLAQDQAAMMQQQAQAAILQGQPGGAAKPPANNPSA